MSSLSHKDIFSEEHCDNCMTVRPLYGCQASINDETSRNRCIPTYPASKKNNGWCLQRYEAMVPIFSMRFANKLVGMGRDGFCQAISLHLQLIISKQTGSSR